MHSDLQQFISRAQTLAKNAGLQWDFHWDREGKVAKAERWNLTKLRGEIAKPTFWLGVVSLYAPSFQVLTNLGRSDLVGDGQSRAMPPAWVELYKAIIVHDQLVKGNKPGNSIQNLGSAVRILATCAGNRSPGEITADDARLAFNVALRTAACAKRGALLQALIAQWFDLHRLSENAPLSIYCTPYPDEASAAQFQKLENMGQREVDHARLMKLRTTLNQQHAVERLPDERSFWELVRILFTEAPISLVDALRFAELKILLLTGFRVGELVSMPVDTLRRIEHLDYRGRRAGLSGGVSETISLRHFAEKKPNGPGSRKVELIEAFQHVPEAFRPTIEQCVADVLRLTSPMRAVLAAQVASGRFLPDLAPDSLVPSWDIYVRLTGFAGFSSAPISPEMLAKYRSDHDPHWLEAIRGEQLAACVAGGPNYRMRQYYRRAAHKFGRWITRDRQGRVIVEPEGESWILVADAEAFAQVCLTTKLSDLRSAEVAGGARLEAHEFLFLRPTRALAEALHGAVTDTSRYAGVARASTKDIIIQLGGTLYERYSARGDLPFQGIEPHSLRHLQNTELFRHGLADTIITKRFNRRSVTESYSYDHRSLGEHLRAAEAPPIADGELEPHALSAWRLILADRIRGPVVDQFLEIQKEQGDGAAFAYLNAEAQALHVTPYGFCLNSFAVTPCPKHLECFNGCGHLVRSDDPAEQGRLIELQGRLEAHITRAKERPSRAPGFANQLRHAEVRLRGVTAALAQQPGGAVFPEGEDRHLPFPSAAASLRNA